VRNAVFTTGELFAGCAEIGAAPTKGFTVAGFAGAAGAPCDWLEVTAAASALADGWECPITSINPSMSKADSAAIANEVASREFCRSTLTDFLCAL